MEPGILRVKSVVDLFYICLFEFIGTTIVLMGINLANGRADVVIATIFTAAILTCRVSGAHFNGALSLAIYVLEAKWFENLPILITSYIGAQGGAFFGTAIAFFIRGKEGMPILRPFENASFQFVIVVEMLYTVIMILVILQVKYGQISPSTDCVLCNAAVMSTIFGLAM